MGLDEVQVTRNNEGEELLSCPEGLWLENGRLRHVPIPDGKEH